MRTGQTGIAGSKKSHHTGIGHNSGSKICRLPGIRTYTRSKICHLPGIGANVGSKNLTDIFINNCLSDKYE